MFPCLLTSKYCCAKIFASQEAKMLPNKFRNIFVAETMFPSFPMHVFPNACRTETWLSRLGNNILSLNTNSANISNTLRFVPDNA